MCGVRGVPDSGVTASGGPAPGPLSSFTGRLSGPLRTAVEDPAQAVHAGRVLSAAPHNSSATSRGSGTSPSATGGSTADATPHTVATAPGPAAAGPPH